MALWAYSSFLAATSTRSCILGIFYSLSLRMDIFWAGIAAEAARFYASLLHWLNWAYSSRLECYIWLTLSCRLSSSVLSEF